PRQRANLWGFVLRTPQVLHGSGPAVRERRGSGPVGGLDLGARLLGYRTLVACQGNRPGDGVSAARRWVVVHVPGAPKPRDPDAQSWHGRRCLLALGEW